VFRLNFLHFLFWPLDSSDKMYNTALTFFTCFKGNLGALIRDK
jgi:hypothetical protein